MKFISQFRMPVLLTVLVSLAACHDTETNTPDRKEILSQPPYAALSDSIVHDSKNARLYLERAALLSQNNLHTVATADFKKAWDLQPDEATGLEYASNLLITNQASAAAGFLQQCVEKFPQNTEFRRRLSEVYVQMNMPDKAIAEYRSIVQADPDNFMAYYQMGMLQARLRDTAAAISSLEKSFSLQPLMYTGLELANIYASSNNPKAVTLCNELLKRDSADGTTDASYIKGTYYFNVGKYADAIRQYDETIRRDWKFVNAYLDKGIILFTQKKYDQALETFSKAALVENTNPDAYYWLGRTYEATHQNDQAIENYQRTLALDRTFSEARDHLRKLIN